MKTNEQTPTSLFEIRRAFALVLTVLASQAPALTQTQAHIRPDTISNPNHYQMRAPAQFKEADVFSSHTISLNDLSKAIEPLQAALKSDTDKQASQIFLMGGTARSVLTHVLDGSPLVLRDIDLAVRRDKPLTEADWQRLETELTRTFRSEQVNLTDRYSPHPNGPQTLSIFSGRMKIDLSFHTDAQLFNQYGLFDFDLIRFPVSPARALLQTTQLIQSMGANLALERGLFTDPKNGLENWRMGNPRINPERLTDFTAGQLQIRSIRTLAKLGVYRLPDEIISIINFVHETRPETDFGRRNWVKLFLRVLADEDGAPELKELLRLGGLNDWSPSLQRELSKKSVDEIRALLNEPPVSAAQTRAETILPLKRYRALIELADLAEQTVLIEDIKKISPTDAAAWLDTAAKRLEAKPSSAQPTLHQGRFIEGSSTIQCKLIFAR